MDITQFSSTYTVRTLDEADIPLLLRLGASNPQFFRYSSGANTAEEYRLAITVAPPGIPPEQKYYVGLFDGETLVAALDLIDGYPDRGTAFLGFFMVAAERSGKGVGSAIISELMAYLKSRGFRRVRLGIDKGNPQSSHFWQKNGFVILREVDRGQDVVLLAEREI